MELDELPKEPTFNDIYAIALFGKGRVIGLFIVSKVTFGCFVLHPH